MYSGGLPAVVLLACVLTFTTAQLSCKETCGQEYYRGNMCQCDYTCLIYEECCEDYESLCTTKESCKGRCGEKFQRGRMCSCDIECLKYNQCCPDYKEHCQDQDTTPGARDQPAEGDDPASKQIPESTSGSPPTNLTTEPPLPDLDGFEILPEPTSALYEDETTPGSTTAAPTTAEPTAASTTAETTAASTTAETTAASTTAEPIAASMDADDTTIAPEPTTVVSLMSTQPTPDPTTSFTELQTEPTQKDLTTTAEATSPASEMTSLVPEVTSATETTEETTTLKYKPSATPENTEPSTTVPTTTSEETITAQVDTTPAPVEAMAEMSTLATTNAELESTTATEQDITQSPTISATSKPAEKPSLVKPFRPLLRPELKPVLNGLGEDGEYQADDGNDPDLCSGRPISGVTTLSNGTVVVFRGHNFWVLDQNRVPGPARGITQVWGVPSPIDTVFTRCNCQGKTYIFKGPQYWRYENDSLDPGYPKVVQTGFDGLKGHITAALSVPQHNRRKESVYFFKRGGTVQKYSYQFGTNPSCGRKVQYAVYRHPNRRTRQVSAQVSVLGPAINYTTSWRGFPTTITAAVSIPNKREPEGYNYYVFSRSKSYKIRMNGERPVVVASKPKPSPQSNEVFKCPKKASRSQ